MIEHCISAFKKYQLDKAYRIYVTDSLKGIVENTARINGGVNLTLRYVDIINPLDGVREKTARSAGDVVSRIRKKFTE